MAIIRSNRAVTESVGSTWPLYVEVEQAIRRRQQQARDAGVEQSRRDDAGPRGGD